MPLPAERITSERIAGVGLDDLFVDLNGDVWKVQGIAETPTVTLARVGTTRLEDRRVDVGAFHQPVHLVIGSPAFNDYTQLIPKGEDDASR